MSWRDLIKKKEEDELWEKHKDEIARDIARQYLNENRIDSGIVDVSNNVVTGEITVTTGIAFGGDIISTDRRIKIPGDYTKKRGWRIR